MYPESFKEPVEMVHPEEVPTHFSVAGIDGNRYTFEVYPNGAVPRGLTHCLIGAVQYLRLKNGRPGEFNLYMGYAWNVDDALSRLTKLGALIYEWEATYILICQLSDNMNGEEAESALLLLHGPINKELKLGRI